jgi:peptidyl-prolyl cis-trans isomerase C
MTAPNPCPPSRPEGATPARAVRAVAAGVLLLLAALAGCSAPPAPADGPGAASRPRVWNPGQPDTAGPILAVVGWNRITRHQVDSVLSTAPPGVWQQYHSDPAQYGQLVQRMVETEVFHQAALRDSIQKDSLYQAELAARTYELAVRHYYRRQMLRAPAPSDSQITALYNDRAKEFDVPGRVRVKHILYATRQKALAGRQRLMKGAAWDSVAARESKDKTSARNGGLLGYVADDSDLVPGIGKSEAIATAAFALKEGEISQPIRTDRGWHLLIADERKEAYRRPIDEVRGQLTGQVQSDLNEKFTQDLLDSLKEYTGVTVYEDSIKIAIQPARTPQELFEHAQATLVAADRIELYRQLIARYPKERVSEQAAFMIGFTYAEEMNDYASARTAFQDFIRDHPQSDLVKSAQWMLDNMEKPGPELDGDDVPPPGDDGTGGPAPPAEGEGKGGE